MDEHLKSFRCIDIMDSKEKDAFSKIVDYFKDEIIESCVKNGAVFTLHDFDHHCLDIYKIISNYLLSNDAFSGGENSLSKREFYILNLAVLFHDIGMFKLQGTRNNHSLKSAEYVREQYESGFFRKTSDLSQNEVNALCEIIKAHSNVKDENGIPLDNTGLQSSELTDRESKYGGSIRTKLLAIILRLADEFDMTSDRLGESSLEEELRAAIDSDDVSEANKSQYRESYDHWMRLHYFSKIQLKARVMMLHIEDKKIKSDLDFGNSLEEIVKEHILPVYSTLNKRVTEFLDIVNDEDLDESKYEYIIPVKSVKIDQEKSEYATEVTKIIEQISARTLVEHKESSKASNPEPVSGNSVTLNADLSVKLYAEVNKRNAVKFGHFRLDSEYCARDWIDTLEIIETVELLNEMTKTIVDDILKLENIDYKNSVIVGVDLEGGLLASRVAISLNMPFSYIISPRNKKYSSDSEKAFISDGRQVIVITDVVVTGRSLNALFESYGISNQICKIYSAFYRKNVDVANELKYPLSVLNDDFRIELFRTANCWYKDRKCKAQNQMIIGNLNE